MTNSPPHDGSGSQNRGTKLSVETRLATRGRRPFAHSGFVNIPTHRGSTVLYETYADLKNPERKAQKSPDGRVYTYGRRGSPTTTALEDALADLEDAERVFLTPSGLSAISTVLFALANAGDHILVTDSTYQPARTFCDNQLRRFGVETEYYDPLIGGGIADLIRPNTRLVYTESPGSQTFEIQDLSPIAAAAKARGVLVVTDNTWATPLFFRPFDFGADVTINAGTKYVVGHADALLGVIAARGSAVQAIHQCHGDLGVSVGPDDVTLALRGLRTMTVRLERHQASAIRFAEWLETRTEIERVIHPALPSHPQHALWKTYFTGSTGLFSAVLKPQPEGAVAALFDALNVFGMGFSWGGYESLAVPFDCAESRTATEADLGGQGIRFHIGLEDPADLMADFEAALDRMRAFSEAA